MVANQMLKQELQTKLEQLSSEKLREVLDFVSFLLSQQSHPVDKQQIKADALTPEYDPLLEFIGAVSHGSLAQDIDDEVYNT